MIAYVVVIGLNITERLYLTAIWDGQNFIAIGVEILSAFSSYTYAFKTPESLVIQQWLKGYQRDKISANSGLSAGAVTNIVNEWKQGLGFANADELRELAVTLKNIGITPVQCAIGFRVGMIMNRLGVKEDDFESFMIEVYNRCKNLELMPERIASFLADLLEFSNSISITEIPNILKEERKKKRN
jgi:hypothetical protein